ncbi:MAG: murein biosynthesis integral membrane protein MurJ [Candidatus Dadabacteria bacterium]|nr:MAG: murein biosynthesis integral membrane protein MurJ [Candidatus Dadabacteria bacterium]
MSNKIIKGTSIIGGITVVSRVLGFVRDLLIARLFGAGMFSDAFFVAFRIPNLLRSFVGEGALTAGFIPIFSEELNKGRQKAQRAISSCAGMLITVTLFLSVACFWFSDEVISLFAPGYMSDSAKFRLTSDLLRIMFPYIVFVSLVVLIGGALNTVEIYGTAALAQVLMNLVFIAGALCAPYFAGAEPYVLAFFVLLGGILQVVIQLPFLKKAGFSLKPTVKFAGRVTKSVALLMAPAIVGAAVYQASIFVNTILATLLKEGSVSWLFYADRIAQLPIGIFSIALGTALLPALSMSSAKGDKKEYEKNILLALRFITVIMLPLSCMMVLLSDEIAIVLFERGAFDRYSSFQTSHALKAYAIGLWGVSINSVLAKAFIATKDTKTPTVAGCISLLAGMLFAVAFMGSPVGAHHGWGGRFVASIQGFLESLFGKGALPSLEHVALALSSSLSAYISCIILGVLLKRRSKSISYAKVSLTAVKTSVCVAIMAVAHSVIFNLISVNNAPFTLRLVAGAAFMGVAFIAAAALLRLEELFLLFKAITKK